jgi:hypothetical protein
MNTHPTEAFQMPSTNNTNPSDQPASSSMDLPEVETQTPALSTQRDLLPDLEHDVTALELRLASIRCRLKRYLKHPVPRPRAMQRPRPQAPELETWRIQPPARAEPRSELIIPRRPLPANQVDAPRGSRDVSYYVNRGILSISRRLQPHTNQEGDPEHRARSAQGAPLVNNETPSVFLPD